MTENAKTPIRTINIGARLARMEEDNNRCIDNLARLGWPGVAELIEARRQGDARILAATTADYATS